MHLGIEEAIRSRFRRILVSQAVLDHLVEYEQQTKGMMGMATVRLPDKNYFSLTAMTRDAMVQRLLAVARRMEVVPTRGLLEADEEHVKYFGTPTLAAILTAEEHGALFYADDCRLRQFACGLKNISSVDTQAVLVNLRKSHGLAKERHASAQTTLAQTRYRQVFMRRRPASSTFGEQGLLYRRGCAALPSPSLMGRSVKRRPCFARWRQL